VSVQTAPPQSLYRGRGELTAVGLRLPPGLDYEQWRQAGKRLCRLHSASSWAIGDWLLYGEWQYGRRYEDALELTGLAYTTLADLKYVAGRFDHAWRRKELSLEHHRVVAALPHREADAWLKRAAAEGWPRGRLRREVAVTRPRRVRVDNGDTAAAADPASPVATGRALVAWTHPAPRPEPAGRRLRLELAAEQAGRWQNAAARDGLELTAWVLAVCDQAAA
jgi:hypothetical protein